MNQAAKEALRLAETHGAYVFPCLPGRKTPPPGFRWKDQATNDPDRIRAAARHKKYRGYNWALNCERSHMTVIDVDRKMRDGTLIDGEAALRELPGLTTGLRAATPSGGYHLIFQGMAPSTVGKLGQGVDTRGIGGYVILPGSTNEEGKPYKWLDFGDPAPLPAWVPERLSQITQKDPERDNPITDEKPHHVEAARRYLLDSAPEAHEGDGGDHTTYTVACHLRDLGVHEDTAYNLMLEHWNDEKAHPPWRPDDLLRKVKNAYRYASNRPGVSTPEALFPPAPGLFGSARSAGDVALADIEPRCWVLGRRYLAGNVTVTSAAGGTGKSLLGLVEGLAVASGRSLTGDAVELEGNVLVYNAEDPPDELDRRILAAKRHHGVTDEQARRLRVLSGHDVEMKFAAYDDQGRVVINRGLIDGIIENIKAWDVRLLIIDPLVDVHNLNENNNPDMNLLMKQFLRIASATNCAVSIFHHIPKGSSTRGRGEQDQARGAGAIMGSARIGHTLFPMTQVEAKVYGVPEARRLWYLRLDRSKGNFSAPEGLCRWFEKHSVTLLPGEDSTGTIQPVDLELVVGESDDDLIRAAVLDWVLPGKIETIYKLARRISDEKIVDLGWKTVRRRIESLFRHTVQDKGLTWRCTEMPERKGPTGGLVTGIECEHILRGRL